MNETNCGRTNGSFKTLLSTICLMATISTTAAQAASDVAPEAIGEHPPTVPGIVVKALDEQPVPDMLKNMARKEIAQMAERGYVDAPDDAIGYIEKAQQNVGAALKPWPETQGKLKMKPASIQGKEFESAGMRLLGAATSGTLTPEGWTGLTRLFVARGIGVVMLEEIDYVAAGGGLMMIKEAINEDINGRPAILRVKKGQGGKALTELTWATDNKIYTLSTNSAVQGNPRTAFLDLARQLSDY